MEQNLENGSMTTISDKFMKFMPVAAFPEIAYQCKNKRRNV